MLILQSGINFVPSTIMKNIIYYLLLFFVSLLISCTSIEHFSSNRNKQDYNFPKIFKNEIQNLANSRKKLIDEAKKWIGIPYCYGGTNNCVDCSGLTQNVYKSIGIILPRTASEQANYGEEISLYDALPGDLLFFGNNTKVTHVAIYIGNNEIIHSSSSRGVICEKLNSSLFSSYKFARRILKP